VTTRRLVVVGILVSLFLAGVVSFYASSHPDGLEFVAGEKGFLHSAGAHASDDSPFAGYATRGVENARLSGGIAGVVGAALVFVLAGGLFLVVRRRDQADTAGDTARDPRRDGDG
jgi:cobalt/nickel transport system permease protein/cobalt/nickel transport protein